MARMGSVSEAKPQGVFALALRMPLWFLVRPSAWQQFIAGAVADPLFCLAELRAEQWRNPSVWRSVVASCVVLPLMSALVTSLVLITLGRFDPFVWAGMGLGALLGLLFITIVNLPAGAMVSLTAIAAFGIAFSGDAAQGHAILIDFMLDTRMGWVLGLCGGASVAVTGSIGRRALSYSSPRQIGSVVIGLIVGGAAIAAIAGISTSIIDGRQVASDTSSSLGLFFALIPGVLYGLTAFLRTSRLNQAALIASISFVCILLVYGDAGHAYGSEPSPPQILVSVLVLFCSTFATLFVLTHVVVERIAGAWAGVIAGALAGLGAYWCYWRVFNMYALQDNLLIAAVLTTLGLTLHWWRPMVSYPLEAALGTILFQAETRRQFGARMLRWHPAFWDEGQWLPIYGLDGHVLLVCERDADEGRRWIDRIATTRQRWAAQAVQIELDARRLDACATVDDIATQSSLSTPFDLQGQAGGLLSSFGKIANDVRAALIQSSNYNRQLVLRAVRGDLDALVGALTRSNETVARRFRPVAVRWHGIVSTALGELERDALDRREIPSPYIVGQPITRHQEIFVGRADASARIEALLRHDDQPPLLLYGQRRMGKTSLLFNLRWMLPNRIVPLVVDLQGPVAQSSDHAGFLYNLAKGIVQSAARQSLLVEPLTREAVSIDPFTGFDDWLDGVEAALVAQGRETILLALDEFESLDAAMTAGRLREDAVLGLLRHIIQYRPRFKLIFAGSHTLQEFAHWSSYLINVETIHLSYLREGEAVQLIKRPVKDFSLMYQPEALRRVLGLTHAHPYLVQLLCAEIIALKNEQNARVRYCSTVDDVDAAVPHALERGRQFFAEIETNQLDADAVAALRTLAACSAVHAVPRDELVCAIEDKSQHRIDDVLSLLTRRELIEITPNGYAFQVELIRRWFAQ